MTVTVIIVGSVNSPVRETYNIVKSLEDSLQLHGAVVDGKCPDCVTGKRFLCSGSPPDFVELNALGGPKPASEAYALKFNKMSDACAWINDPNNRAWLSADERFVFAFGEA